MSLRVAATRAVSWTLVESVGSKLISFLLFTVLARLVAPADFGIVQMAQTVAGMAWVLAEQGVTAYVIQKSELSKEALSTAFWIGLFLACSVAALAIAAAPLVSSAYAATEVTAVLRAIVLLLPVSALSWIHAALMARELAFKTIASRRLIAVCTSCVCGVLLAVQGFGVWSLVGKIAIETVLFTVLAWMACPWRPGLKLDSAELRPMVTTGARLTAGHLVGHASVRADDILIGLYLGPTALGYYAVAVRAMILAQEVAVSTAQRAAMPVFSRLQSDIARLASAYTSALAPASAICIPVFLGISASAYELCFVLFGSEWLPAVPAMRVLGLSGLAIGGSLFFSPLVLGTGRAQLFSTWQFVSAPLNLVALWVGVHYGLIGVAVASLVRSHIWLFASFWTAQRVLDISVLRQAKLLSAPVTASVFMVVCVLCTRQVLPGTASLASFAVVVGTGVASYILGMAIVSRQTIRNIYQLAASLRPQRGEDHLHPRPAGRG